MLEHDDNDFARTYMSSSSCYDVVKLWRLSQFLPSFSMTAVEFPVYLNRESAWSDDSRTPMQLATDENHWERILEVDMSHPIMTRMADDGMRIVDGFHRIAKAYLEGRQFIDAVDVTHLLPQCLTVLPPEYEDAQ